MSVNIEKIGWCGWPNCHRISNGDVELIVTGDIGPRIMRYGFVGGSNLFKEYTEQLGLAGEPEWQLRGGHRLWTAPEHISRTYAADNGPVIIGVEGGILTATQPVEPSTGIEKQIVVKLAASGTQAEIVHRLRNTLAWPIEFAAWALTMMAQNGTGVTGFPPRGKHPDILEPTNPLVMWAFTDLRDRRWKLLHKYLVLHQDPNDPRPTKLGIYNEHTWGAYLLGSDLFIKQAHAPAVGIYPDRGCSYETFTRNDMLEIETLGPVTRVEPGASLEHVEHWSLHRDVVVPEWTDEAIDRNILPLIPPMP